jgi:hypothetical protein
MADSSHEHMGQGIEILKQGLSPYITRQLRSHYKERWWKAGVENSVGETVGLDEGVIEVADSDEQVSNLDIHELLEVMWNSWRKAFHEELGDIGRTLLGELKEVENRWAQEQFFNPEDAHRALDTMTRMLDLIGSTAAETTTNLAHELLTQQIELDLPAKDRPGAFDLEGNPLAGLLPWRQVTRLHPDIISGRFIKNAFEANLFQVLSNSAKSEHSDPVRFIRRTYFTSGLIRLVLNGWKRVLGLGGEAVVGLHAGAGGGKTHSMLALYHLLNREVTTKNLPGLEELESIKEEWEGDLPVVSRAVLPCLRFSGDNPWAKDDGTEVHTLWGEMAWQLGGKEGYAYVSNEDQHGLGPSSGQINELFDRFGPALVLVDDWVAYARHFVGKGSLPAGTYEANLAFLMSLVTAARSSKEVLVVAAVPLSTSEIGGEHGRKVQEKFKKIFGQAKAVWKPSRKEEIIQIIRKQLFEPSTQRVSRDEVSHVFGELYRANMEEFPSECDEESYEERIKSCYPIHPELFERLYHDWSTLEGFQSMHGMLRILAIVVHVLWKREDQSRLILPSMLPLDSSGVRAVITRYLPVGWNAVIQKDVDGDKSLPIHLDRELLENDQTFACQRVARTVFMGSSPSIAKNKIRGIDLKRIKLGSAQPGEPLVVLSDALDRLYDDLAYLYCDESGYWYDIHTTGNSIAKGRAAQLGRLKIANGILRVLEEIRETAGFSGVHVAPAASGEVPDAQSCRLVILGPSTLYRKGDDSSPGHVACQEILDHYGDRERSFRNMLVFLLADSDRLQELKQAVRTWLAWSSILRDEGILNLNEAQRKQVEVRLTRAGEGVRECIDQTYCHLLIPELEGTGRIELKWMQNSGEGSIIEKAANKLVREGKLVVNLSASHLREELDRWLWRDVPHLGIKKLWEYLCTYNYLARLRDHRVLFRAIQEGVDSPGWQEYFAHASAYDEDNNRYQNLTAASKPRIILDETGVLVKPEVAKVHLELGIE